MTEEKITNLEALKKEFDTIKKDYEQDDKTRENIINISRKILKPSKMAIYAIHRDDMEKADKLITEAKERLINAHSLLDASGFDSNGSFNAALEEYIEACAYFTFIKENKLILRKDLNLPFDIPHEKYLLALSDFTGEIVRKAVVAATLKETSTVIKIGNTIEELYGLFLEFNFRSGELRKKFDILKYNLSKVQTIIYDINLKQR